MTTVPFAHVVSLAVILFSIGLLGVFLRRDAITLFLSVEVMLNSANVLFIGASRFMGQEAGQVFALIVIVVAACEAALGLSLVVRLHQTFNSVHPDEIANLRG